MSKLDRGELCFLSQTNNHITTAPFAYDAAGNAESEFKTAGEKASNSRFLVGQN